jgi:dTDP-4-dehydrorhamnose reductase
VRDQFNTPTLADDLADVLLWLADRRATGFYHTAGPDLVGRHEWALAIAEQFSLDASLMDWVTTEELAQPASRPRFSGLICDRLAAEIAAAPDGAPTLRGVPAGLRDIPWLG